MTRFKPCVFWAPALGRTGRSSAVSFEGELRRNVCIERRVIAPSEVTSLVGPQHRSGPQHRVLGVYPGTVHTVEV
ncbi:hypothetical protein Taro_047688 [Colocasia esculenta]|uniref:Uncharacterized protein n=1 Tax=Colocasia esculenta TaxID=4460 RepID=A0A843X5P9_COLES|nr:hypothetical protein [Colocasia esculenta]